MNQQKNQIAKIFAIIIGLIVLIIGIRIMTSEPKVENADIKINNDLLNNGESSGTQINNQTENTTSTTQNINNKQKIGMKEVIVKTNKGDITLRLNGERTPVTVNNFVKLAEAGFYNGTRFHRVIKDFMIQGGDPLSKEIGQKNYWGQGGPDYKFADEVFADDNMREGDIAMANAGPGTNGSQFFIVTAEATSWLNGKHTIFGKVIKGMDVVKAIEDTKVDANDRPVDDVIVNSVEVLK